MMMVREKNGHFAKGNSGNPAGRPKRTTEAEYLLVLRNHVSIDDWKAIIDRAVMDAKRGDTAARKWISDYLIGPPVERKEITGADGNSLQIVIMRDEKRD